MLSSFKDLLAATGTPANAGRGILDALRERLLPSLKWRQAQLINKLYERRHAGDYAESARAMAEGPPGAARARHGWGGDRPALRSRAGLAGPFGTRARAAPLLHTPHAPVGWGPVAHARRVSA